jgi:hypothetical protein
MPYILYTFIIFSVNAATIFDQDMQKGKELFDKQNYEEASGVFALLNKSTQGRNSAVLFNLGNCYFKTGKYGYARAYYMKALSISPRDGDIMYNMAYVDSVLNIRPQGVFSGILSSVSMDEACIILIISFALACIFIMFYKRHSKALLLWGGFFAFLFAFSLFFAVAKAVGGRGAAISLEKNVLRAAPAEASTVLAELPEGASLYVTEKTGDWTRVSLSDDYVGWVKKDSIMELEL